MCQKKDVKIHKKPAKGGKGTWKNRKEKETGIISMKVRQELVCDWAQSN